MESVLGSFDLLDTQVHPLGWPVRCPSAMMVQDLGPPLLQGPAQGLDLGNFIGQTRRNRPRKRDGPNIDVVCQVHVSDHFLGESRAEHLIVRVTQAEPFKKSLHPSLIQALSTSIEDPPLPIQRVVFAATMASLFTLDSCTNPSEAALSNSNDVEPVSDLDGMIKTIGHAFAVGINQIRCDDPNLLTPLDARGV